MVFQPQCGRGAEYLILIFPPKKMAHLVQLMFINFTETNFSCTLHFFTRKMTSGMGFAATARGDSTLSSNLLAVKFKTGSRWAATRVQARVPQSRMEKGGLPLGFLPNKKQSAAN